MHQHQHAFYLFYDFVERFDEWRLFTCGGGGAGYATGLDVDENGFEDRWDYVGCFEADDDLFDSEFDSSDMTPEVGELDCGLRDLAPALVSLTPDSRQQ